MKTPYEIIKAPVITEKSMDDAGLRKYTFKVDPKATKTEIKAAVEEAFGVEVEKVNIMNIGGKKKRQGLTLGYTSDYKKAIITVTAASKTIDFFEGL